MESEPLANLELPGGYHLYTFETLPNTMDKAHELAKEGAAHGTLVLAQNQTEGRGRRGSVWVAPPGNLNLSVILRPEFLAAQLPFLSFALCVAMGHALLPFLPDQGMLAYKWPNDLLLDGKKVGGCLLEVELGKSWTGQPAWVVGGVGLNMQHHPSDLPYPATSLAEQSVVTDQASLLSRFCCELFELLSVLQAQGFSPIQRAWMARSWGVGKRVRVTTNPGRFYEGVVQGVDGDGCLIVQDDKFRKQRIATGEVFFSDLRVAADRSAL